MFYFTLEGELLRRDQSVDMYVSINTVESLPIPNAPSVNSFSALRSPLKIHFSEKKTVGC